MAKIASADDGNRKVEGGIAAINLGFGQACRA